MARTKHQQVHITNSRVSRVD